MAVSSFLLTRARAESTLFANRHCESLDECCVDGNRNTSMMWTIIQRKEDKVFDLIPNCWLLNSSTCHYPNFGLKTTKTFARKCQEPDDSWEVLEMEIVDKDIDNYERGMTNVIRFSKGKKSVTSSEEERNHNKRKKTKNSFFEYDVSHPIGLPALSPASSSNDEDETTNSVKYTKITPTSNVTPPALEPPAKKCVSSTPKKVCKLQNRKHYCVFESTKGVTFESIGHALCVITRKLEMQTSNNSVIKDDIRELRTSLENVRGAAEIQPRGCEEETMLVMNEFPLKNVDEVEALEEKLKAKDFLQACVVYLSSVAEITSESRTVTSIMSRILTLETAMCYTWKGVCRKDHKFQKKPFNKLTLSYVVLAAVKRCWPECDKGKVETSASVWIAQAKAKADRLSAKKVVAEDAEDAHL